MAAGGREDTGGKTEGRKGNKVGPEAQGKEGKVEDGG